MSALILAGAGISAARRSASARALLASFLQHVDDEPTAALDRAVVLRSSDPNLSRRELETK
jgi:hypothetical protein